MIRLPFKVARLFGRKSPNVAALASRVTRRRHELHNGDVFIASYPRSGNTWIRLLLADVIQQMHGYETATILPIHHDSIVPNLDRGDLLTSDSRIQLPFRLIKTHSFYRPAIKRAIVVVRSPGSCLCSYFHFCRRHGRFPESVSAGIDRFCGGLIHDWRSHSQSYLEALERGRAEVFLTSYEQLYSQTVTVLQAVLMFLGLDAAPEMCRRAIENHQLDKHRANEHLRTWYKGYVFGQGEVDSAGKELSAATLKLIERTAMPTYRRTEQWLTLRTTGEVA